MRFTKQGYKELIDKGASLIISDELPTEDLIFLAQYAVKKGNKLTIRSGNKTLEDLKKISSAGKSIITIEILHT